MWTDIPPGSSLPAVPTSVTDADNPMQGLSGKEMIQVDELSLAMVRFRLSGIYYADACRLITPVFQSFQAFKNDRCGILFSQIAYNSTHVGLIINIFNIRYFPHRFTYCMKR